MAYIAATATAVPEYYYEQDVLAATLKKYCGYIGLDIELSVIDSLFKNTNIDGRYFSATLDSFFDPPGLKVRSQMCSEAATDLCEKTVRQVLDRAGLEPSDISQLVSMMSTVVMIPTVDAMLMNRIPFAPHTKRAPMNGLGCMGGVSGLSRVADYLDGHPHEAVILISCELGGTAFWQGGVQGYLNEVANLESRGPTFYSDLISQIVSVALFGDGAGAVLMVGDHHRLARPGLPRVLGSRSGFLHNTHYVAGVDVLDKGFHNRLSIEVPQLAKIGLRPVLGGLLDEHGLSVADIGHWIIHPGGPKVLQATAEEFGLQDDDLKLSEGVLARIGNVSAPTVLYMLDETFARYSLPEGTYGIVMGMGPGFSQEAVLLQW
jgi:alkylresorcinol/alkylpyrone synthase